MHISIIVAMGHRKEIGLKENLPWHLGSDLRNFKKLTMGHSVLFGRKTFASLGKVLEGRKVLVLTHNTAYEAPHARTVSTLTEAIALAKSEGESELFIAGGAQIYKEALPLANKLYLTHVDYDGEADTYFPEYSLEGWEQSVSTFHPAHENELAWKYEVWTRKA